MNRKVFFACNVLLTLTGLGLVQPPLSLAERSRSVDAWTQQAKLYLNDGWSWDYYGASVALSANGTTLAIGAPEYDKPGDPNPDQGLVTVYVRSGNTWSEQQRLTAPYTYGGDRFGSAVALSGNGNTLLIGARTQDIGSNIQRGSAYVFTRSGTMWTQQKKLYAPDGWDYDEFGGVAAISEDGNTAVVGAIGDDTGSIQEHGAAYVFVRDGSNWSTQEKLTSSKIAYECFGGSMAISNDGDTIVVGIKGRDLFTLTNPGTAYVFTRSGDAWTLQQQLNPTDGANDDNFGSAVAINSETNTLVVAAPGFPNLSAWKGALYVFGSSGGTWTQLQKVTASDVVAGDRFGSAVAINSNGDTLLAGAMYQDFSGNSDEGTAYVFKRSNGTWVQQQKLTAEDGNKQDEFGSAVAINDNGNTVAVGAWYASAIETEQGAAYVFFNRPVYPFNLSLPLILR